MEDLNAASLEDVKTWFKTYYGAANVVLVLAGDIDAETAREKVEHYFAEIPAGPPVARHEKWIPRITGTRRETVSDRVPQARLYKLWNIPPHGDGDTVRLHLATEVLASGKSSRLYKRLVYDEQLATDVSAYVWALELSGLFGVTATARPGGDLKKVEQAIDEEMARFLASGPTAEELERAKAQQFAGFVRGIQRVGGFGGKSDILAMNQTYRGNADYYQVIWKIKREATTGDLQNAARRWLTDDVYVLEVRPYPNYETASHAVERAKLPMFSGANDARFPVLQRTNLSNGMRIILAERHAAP
jgi:zinc protease